MPRFFLFGGNIKHEDIQSVTQAGVHWKLDKAGRWIGEPIAPVYAATCSVTHSGGSATITPDLQDESEAAGLRQGLHAQIDGMDLALLRRLGDYFL